MGQQCNCYPNKCNYGIVAKSMQHSPDRAAKRPSAPAIAIAGRSINP
jgi:hypothetical protein